MEVYLNMIKLLKCIIFIIGLISLITNSIVVSLTFLIAYFSGNYQAILVDINRYNEANIEIVIVVVMGLCSIYTIYKIITWISGKNGI